MSNIILIGYMGCGKSTIGKKLSYAVRKPYVDTDKLIETKEKKTISTIFSEQGEEAFREMETACIKSLFAQKQEHVIYEPYRIKVLNTINFKKSMHYNPFAYLHSEKDILKLVTTLIANTKGEGKAGDDLRKTENRYDKTASAVRGSKGEDQPDAFAACTGL